VFHMPHYYNHKDTNAFGKVTVTPKGIRRFKVGDYSIWPYVTMSKIRFTLRVEKFPQSNGINKKDFNVYIKLGDNSYRSLITLTSKETDIEGIAHYTGDTKFFIAPAGYPEKYIDKEGVLLFDDNVLSINHYVWGGCSVAALLTAFLCGLLGWLLGFIQIIPERIIWWPW
jgi:hypothetical protein